MKSSLETVELCTPTIDAEVSASDAWSATKETTSEPFFLPRFAGTAAAALFALGGTTATALEEDLWLAENSPSATTTTAANKLQEMVGRPVSRAEALRTARAILERAEQERLALAENEARVGIQWED